MATKSSMFICPYCSVIYMTSIAYRRHIENEHQNRPSVYGNAPWMTQMSQGLKVQTTVPTTVQNAPSQIAVVTQPPRTTTGQAHIPQNRTVLKAVQTPKTTQVQNAPSQFVVVANQANNQNRPSNTLLQVMQHNLIQQPTMQQNLIQQPTMQQNLIRQPTLQRPRMLVPTVQQSMMQQPRSKQLHSATTGAPVYVLQTNSPSQNPSAHQPVTISTTPSLQGLSGSPLLMPPTNSKGAGGNPSLVTPTASIQRTSGSAPTTIVQRAISNPLLVPSTTSIQSVSGNPLTVPPTSLQVASGNLSVLPPTQTQEGLSRSPLIMPVVNAAGQVMLVCISSNNSTNVTASNTALRQTYCLAENLACKDGKTGPVLETKLQNSSAPSMRVTEKDVISETVNNCTSKYIPATTSDLGKSLTTKPVEDREQSDARFSRNRTSDKKQVRLTRLTSPSSIPIRLENRLTSDQENRGLQNENAMVKCNICNVIFSNYDLFSTHIKRVHQKDLNSDGRDGNLSGRQGTYTMGSVGGALESNSFEKSKTADVGKKANYVGNSNTRVNDIADHIGTLNQFPNINSGRFKGRCLTQNQEDIYPKTSHQHQAKNDNEESGCTEAFNQFPRTNPDTLDPISSKQGDRYPESPQQQHTKIGGQHIKSEFSKPVDPIYSMQGDRHPTSTQQHQAKIVDQRIKSEFLPPVNYPATSHQQQAMIADQHVRLELSKPVDPISSMQEDRYPVTSHQQQAKIYDHKVKSEFAQPVCGCVICNKYFYDMDSYVTHMQSQDHDRKIAESFANLSSATNSVKNPATSCTSTSQDNSVLQNLSANVTNGMKTEIFNNISEQADRTGSSPDGKGSSPDENNLVVCFECKIVFSDQGMYEYHMQRYHHGSASASGQQNPAEANGSANFSKCKRPSKDNNNLPLTMHACIPCQTVFATHVSYIKHQAMHHPSLVDKESKSTMKHPVETSDTGQSLTTSSARSSHKSTKQDHPPMSSLVDKGSRSALRDHGEEPQTGQCLTTSSTTSRYKSADKDSHLICLCQSKFDDRASFTKHVFSCSTIHGSNSEGGVRDQQNGLVQITNQTAVGESCLSGSVDDACRIQKPVEYSSLTKDRKVEHTNRNSKEIHFGGHKFEPEQTMTKNTSFVDFSSTESKKKQNGGIKQSEKLFDTLRSHTKSNSKIAVSPSNGPNDILACLECNQVFADAESYVVHIKCHNPNHPILKELKTGNNERHYLGQKESPKLTDLNPDQQVFGCSICNMVFSDKATFDAHVKSHNPILGTLNTGKGGGHLRQKESQNLADSNHDQQVFGCTTCKMLFSDKAMFDAHVESHNAILGELNTGNKGGHLGRKDSHKLKDLNPDQQVFGCTTCKILFSDKARFDAHMESHNPILGELNTGNGGGHLEKEKSKNLADLNSDQQVFGCSICNMVFSDKFMFDAHVESHNPILGKLNTGKGGGHLRQKESQNLADSNHDQQIFGCTTCKMVFSDKTMFDVHVKSHNPILGELNTGNGRGHLGRKKSHNFTLSNPDQQVFGCAICNMVFSDKAMFDVHVESHNPIAISDSEDEAEESRTHLTDGNIRKQRKMEAHNPIIISVSDQQVFGCTTCKMVFSDKAMFDAHMESHSTILGKLNTGNGGGHLRQKESQNLADLNPDQQVFGCAICNMVFSDKAMFDTHVESHNPIAISDSEDDAEESRTQLTDGNKRKQRKMESHNPIVISDSEDDSNIPVAQIEVGNKRKRGGQQRQMDTTGPNPALHQYDKFDKGKALYEFNMRCCHLQQSQAYGNYLSLKNAVLATGRRKSSNIGHDVEATADISACTECNIVFADKTQYQTHMQLHRSKSTHESRLFKCSMCGALFDSSLVFKEHARCCGSAAFSKRESHLANLSQDIVTLSDTDNEVQEVGTPMDVDKGESHFIKDGDCRTVATSRASHTQRVSLQASNINRKEKTVPSASTGPSHASHLKPRIDSRCEPSQSRGTRKSHSWSESLKTSTSASKFENYLRQIAEDSINLPLSANRIDRQGDTFTDIKTYGTFGSDKVTNQFDPFKKAATLNESHQKTSNEDTHDSSFKGPQDAIFSRNQMQGYDVKKPRYTEVSSASEADYEKSVVTSGVKDVHPSPLSTYEVNKVPRKIYQCKKCPKEFESKRKLKRHLHFHPLILKCKFCKDIFTEKRFFLKHKKNCSKRRTQGADGNGSGAVPVELLQSKQLQDALRGTSDANQGESHDKLRTKPNMSNANHGQTQDTLGAKYHMSKTNHEELQGFPNAKSHMSNANNDKPFAKTKHKKNKKLKRHYSDDAKKDRSGDIKALNCPVCSKTFDSKRKLQKHQMFWKHHVKNHPSTKKSKEMPSHLTDYTRSMSSELSNLSTKLNTVKEANARGKHSDEDTNTKHRANDFMPSSTRNGPLSNKYRNCVPIEHLTENGFNVTQQSNDQLMKATPVTLESATSKRRQKVHGFSNSDKHQNHNIESEKESKFHKNNQSGTQSGGESEVSYNNGILPRHTNKRSENQEQNASRNDKNSDDETQSDEKLTDTDSNQPPPPSNLTCPICAAAFHCKTDLERHSAAHQQLNIKKEVIGQEDSSSDGSDDSSSEEDNLATTFDCMYCKAEFQDRDMYMIHIQYHITENGEI